MTKATDPFKQQCQIALGCQLCCDSLTPRPVVVGSQSAQILIIGQAPGKRVHETGIPFNDPSGDRLRDWMQIDKTTFYDANKIAIIPMGLCYPGKGKGGDNPPDKRCAPLWHPQLLPLLPQVKLTLLVGRYAQAHYLALRGKTLTDTVKHYQDCLPHFLPLPHPSPRNRRWLSQNPWFEADVVPILRRSIAEILS